VSIMVICRLSDLPQPHHCRIIRVWLWVTHGWYRCRFMLNGSTWNDLECYERHLAGELRGGRYSDVMIERSEPQDTLPYGRRNVALMFVQEARYTQSLANNTSVAALRSRLPLLTCLHMLSASDSRPLLVVRCRRHNLNL
jgi:hypothetical protein